MPTRPPTRRAPRAPLTLVDAASTGRPLPRNLSEPVPCPLPGYEGMSVVYCLSLPPDAIDATETWYEQAALVIDHFAAWPFNVPPPEPGNAASFHTIGQDCLRWLASGGYRTAVQAYVGKYLTP